MVLPGGMVRPITKVEHDYYRAPYLQESSREVPYRWANEVPIEGSPADVYEIVETYHKWLLENDIPKLFFLGGAWQDSDGRECEVVYGDVEKCEGDECWPGISLPAGGPTT